MSSPLSPSAFVSELDAQNQVALAEELQEIARLEAGISRARMLTLRRATPADAPAAARIIAVALAEYGLPFDLEGRDADVATFGGKTTHDDVVALDGAEVVGVGSVGPQGAPGVAWIAKVFVAATARRHGAGRQIMEALHDAARARGYREVGLRSRVIFDAALAMYAAFGYVRRADEGPLLETGDVVLYRSL